ncbi:MAG: carbon-nitrogen hydrolase family protein [Phycisphaerales bacterium]
MSDTSRMILRTWEQEAREGQAYRLTVRARCPVDLSLPVTAVLEWWVSPGVSESAGGGDPRPHKRVYLSRDPAGWSDVHVAPPRAEHMRVLLCHWRQLGPVPLGTWDFACERAETPEPRTFKAAVACQQTDPNRAQTMESRRDLTVATIEQAGREKAKLLVLSENFFDRGLTTPLTERALALNDPWLEPVYAAIRSAGLHAVFAYHEKNADRIHNCAVLVSPDGQVVGVYRKRHLTQMELEIGLTPGDAWPVFDTPLGRIGMLVCWDGWFPDSAAALARRGVQIICFPLAGDGEANHWEHIWKARALDHQIYWLASVTGDCGGVAPSRIVAPTGDVLAETRQPNGLAFAELTLPVRNESYWLSVGPVWSEIRNVYQHAALPPLQYL